MPATGLAIGARMCGSVCSCRPRAKGSDVELCAPHPKGPDTRQPASAPRHDRDRSVWSQVGAWAKCAALGASPVSRQWAPPRELTRGLRHARRDGRPWHVAGPAPTAPRWAHITRRHNAAARRARAHAGGALPPTSISEHVRGRGEAWNREYLARPGEAASARRDHQSAVS